jgi:hypothetical protein
LVDHPGTNDADAKESDQAQRAQRGHDRQHDYGEVDQVVLDEVRSVDRDVLTP